MGGLRCAVDENVVGYTVCSTSEFEINCIIFVCFVWIKNEKGSRTPDHHTRVERVGDEVNTVHY